MSTFLIWYINYDLNCRSRLEGNQWDNGMVTKCKVCVLKNRPQLEYWIRGFKILYITSLSNVYVYYLLLLLTSSWPSDVNTSLWRQTKPMSLCTYISCTVRDLNCSSNGLSFSVWLGHDQVQTPLTTCRVLKLNIIRRNIPCNITIHFIVKYSKTFILVTQRI